MDIWRTETLKRDLKVEIFENFEKKIGELEKIWSLLVEFDRKNDWFDHSLTWRFFSLFHVGEATLKNQLDRETGVYNGDWFMIIRDHAETDLLSGFQGLLGIQGASDPFL